MKLPISWLNDYTDVSGISPKEYADALTMSGSKVEGVEQLGEEIQNVVAGKILKKDKHPNADTLWVCSVDVGGEIRQIVTGAQNINEGDVVPVAKSVAKLPGGVTIKAGKLRGELSEGMMCSHQELGLGINDFPGACEHGILILGDEYTPGTDIKKILGLDDTVVEFEITSNRPDCLSVIGIARETAATFGRPFSVKKPEVHPVKAESMVKVTVNAPDLCPRYTARCVKNVKIEESPKWMRDRLTACGVRPINNIVDITNYVMLEYNQPMHAFDRNFLKGGQIIVRRAKEGEKITTLDGEERALTKENLVIADAERAVAVAGVMGGLNSEITDDTKEIVFESAMFNGPSVRLTAKALGMRTESSARFEKGLDSENTLDAINRACELVELLGAGEVTEEVVDVYSVKPEKRSYKLEVEKTNNFLGTKISKEDMIKTLTMLGFEVCPETMTVVPPTFRADIEGFADIAEEIARIFGYNNIKSTLLDGDTTMGGRNFAQNVSENVSNALTMLGCYEIKTYSFTHPKSLDKIGRGEEKEQCIRILNPLGEENSIMRNNMIASVMDILSVNYSQRNKNVRVFEIGKIYKADKLPLEKLAEETKMLAIGGYGDMDFFHMKGILEDMFETIGVVDYSFDTAPEETPFHPGKTATVFIKGKAAGTVGEIRPDVANLYEIDENVYVAQIKLQDIIDGVDTERSYTKINRYPAVTRDIAMLVDDEIKAAQVEAVIKKYGGKMLESVTLFDVYKGKQIPEGKKSMAYSASFRAADRTLSDNDINKVMEKILKMLAKELGAELR